MRTNHPDLRLAGGISFIKGTHPIMMIMVMGHMWRELLPPRIMKIGTVGVAPDARIYAVKVLDKNGEGNQSDVAKGVEWAMEQKLGYY